MESRLQLILGYDLMRAAVDGDHDLQAAWNEAMEISVRGAQPLPHVYGGAIAFLLMSVAALEDIDLLEATPPGPRDYFLHSGFSDRQASVYAALEANDAKEINTLATVMINAVLPNLKRLVPPIRVARVPKTS